MGIRYADAHVKSVTGVHSTKRRRALSDRLKIPTDAELVKQTTASVIRGPFAGHRAHMKLYQGESSKGYQSGYERVSMRWFEMTIPTAEFRQAWSYSGRTYKKAMEHYKNAVKDAKDEPGITNVQEIL